MTTRSRYRAGTLSFYEDVAFETVRQLAPVVFKEDFLGAGYGATVPSAGSPVVGSPWVQKIVGAAPPTVGRAANAAGGQMQLALTSASQKQDAVLYWDDSLAIDVTKTAVWEARIKLSVLPSAAGVQFVSGLAAAWIDGPDNNTFYLEFGATANGAILCRSQDGVNQNSIASGVTVLSTEWHMYKIDASVVTDVAFWIDGVRVNTVGSISFAATGANAILQPYNAVYKPSGTGVATALIDKIDAWSSR